MGIYNKWRRIRSYEEVNYESAKSPITINMIDNRVRYVSHKIPGPRTTPPNTGRRSSVGLSLDQLLRRWPRIKATMCYRLMFEGISTIKGQTAVAAYFSSKPLLMSTSYLYICHKDLSRCTRAVHSVVSDAVPMLAQCWASVADDGLILRKHWVTARSGLTLTPLLESLLIAFNVIGNDMSVWTSKFENVCSQIKQMRVIFTHFKLWVAVARYNFKWVKM